MVWEIVVSSMDVLPHESINPEIIDHKQEKPRAELGPLRNSSVDCSPLRETVRGQLDALVSVCQKSVTQANFYTVRHVEAIDLSDKYHMIDKVKGLAVIK